MLRHVISSQVVLRCFELRDVKGLQLMTYLLDWVDGFNDSSIKALPVPQGMPVQRQNIVWKDGYLSKIQ